MSNSPSLKPEASQAAAFSQIRAQHQNETAEDYVELISDLIMNKGEARLVDLSKRLGVSSATASKVIARLKREGLVESEPYRSLFLTPMGDALATQARHKHKIVVGFLCALGLSRDIAERDAEGLEHHCGSETLNALEKIATGAWQIVRNSK